MKKTISLSVLSFFLFLCIGCGEKPAPELTEQIKNGLRTDAKQFMESLKTVLVKEMQINGIVAAVSVCSDTAQVLTNNYGVNKGIYIKRVSSKYRNTNNKPDEFEAKALKYFEELKSSGKLSETTEYYDIVDVDGVKNVRYLKPIIVQAPCLGCHGVVENIGPEVKLILNNKYPGDKATGYQMDELRGAVSIQKTL
jgi:D-ribose pyranose/furanose isomerase RbsD